VYSRVGRCARHESAPQHHRSCEHHRDGDEIADVDTVGSEQMQQVGPADRFDHQPQQS